MGRKRKGFTLIELMMVVAIVGLLSAIAIPKFADLINKSKEAAVKGHLGTYRSAISIYYSDNEGAYPRDFAHNEMISMTPKYIDQIPSIEIPRHHPGNRANHTHVENLPSHRGDMTPSFAPLFHGVNVAWVFDSTRGLLWVNCLHTTLSNVLWSTL